MAEDDASETEALPIELVECRGDHREMGAAQGEAFRAQLASLPRALGEIAGFRRGGILERLTPPLTAGVGRVGRRLVSRHLAREYPEQAARKEGIAAGAGIPLHHLFVAPAVELALNRSIYSIPPAAGCTAMAVSGDRSRTGEPLIAKNFDYPHAALDLYMARLSRPASADRAASIDITAAPLPGSHEGVSEHGLAIAYNYGHFRGKPAARVTITTLVQELLERCRTVDEAIALIARLPRAGGALLMLADAGGDIASVEVAPDHLGVRRGRDCGQLLVHANHAVTNDMAARDVPREAVFPNWWRPSEMRGRRLHESSEARHGRAEDLLAQAGAVDDEDLASILADHGDSDGDDLSICRHGAYYVTTCSVVLMPRRRAMKVMFGSPCESQFSTLSL